MSLSQENIKKLCMTGVYRCDPVISWIESWRRDDPYHCINWTFRVKKYGNTDSLGNSVAQLLQKKLNKNIT